MIRVPAATLACGGDASQSGEQYAGDTREGDEKMNATKKSIVSIYTCSKCGHADFTLSGRKPRPSCPQCGNKFMPVRRLTDADESVIDKAQREDQCR